MSNWLPRDLPTDFQLKPADRPSTESRQHSSSETSPTSERVHRPLSAIAARRPRRCTRCGGNLFFEPGLPGIGTAFDLDVCLQCGEEFYNEQQMLDDQERVRLQQCRR
jgi:DNA-directed RNA polymerase subunit RPC12/RpoP